MKTRLAAVLWGLTFALAARAAEKIAFRNAERLFRR
jgi:Skp family chaperone for outer membrane proteins